MVKKAVRKVVSILLCVLFIAGVFSGLTVNAEVFDGKIHIYTKYNLRDYIFDNIHNYINQDFVLENDIVFDEKDFKSGGSFYNDGKGWALDYNNIYHGFRGTFDGQGHTISGLRINYFSQEYDFDEGYVSRYCCGLFPSLYKATVKNLNISDETICFESYVDQHLSDIWSYSNGYYSDLNCPTSHIGLLAGVAENSSIINCNVNGKIEIKTDKVNNYNEAVGGVVGKMFDSSITKCVSEVNIKADSEGIGGVVGNVYDCSVDNLSYEGNLCSEYFLWCGGIAGRCNSNITDCYNKGTIKTSTANPNDIMVNSRCTGGIAGSCSQIISRCYNKGSVECKNTKSYGRANSFKHYAAGIVGYGAGVSNCYNKGRVACYEYAGGIVGCFGENEYKVECCYNTGKITANEEKPDGICGHYINKQDSTGFDYIKSCYSLRSAVESPEYGKKIATVASAKKLKVKRFYSGFNFSIHWDIRDNKNGGYPFLKKVSKSYLDGDQFIKWSSTKNDLEYPIYTETSFAKQLRYWASITDGFNILSPNADLSEYKKLLHMTVDVPIYGTDETYLVTGETEVKDVMAYILFANRAKEYSQNIMRDIKDKIYPNPNEAYKYFLDRIQNFNSQLYYFQEKLNGKDTYGKGLLALLLASAAHNVSDTYLGSGGEDSRDKSADSLTYKFLTNLTQADVAESNKYYDNIGYYFMSGGDTSYLNPGYSNAVEQFNKAVKYSTKAIKLIKKAKTSSTPFIDTDFDGEIYVDLSAKDLFKFTSKNILEHYSEQYEEIKEVKKVWDTASDVASLIKAACSYNILGVAAVSYKLSEAYINAVKAIYEDMEKSEAGWYALSYYYLSQNNETLLKSLFDPNTGSASFGIDRIAEYGLPYDEGDLVESAIMGRWYKSSYLDHTYTPKEDFRIYLFNACNTLIRTQKTDLYDSVDSLVGYITAKKNMDAGIVGIDVDIKASANYVDLGSVSAPDNGNTAQETSVTATPKENVTFIGWKDTNTNEYVSYDRNYKFMPDGNVSLQAVFAEGTVRSAEKPVITKQPKDLSVYQNEQIPFTIEAVTNDEGQLSVSWYKNTKYSNIGGEKVGTGFSFCPDTNDEGKGYYYAVVENTLTHVVGSKTVTSTSSVRSEVSTVNVRKPIIQNIQITQMPYKTVYKPDEKFDKTGMKIIAEYSDGTTRIVGNYDVSYDFSSTGTKTVKVIASNKTANLTVTVDTPTAIQIVSPPNKTTYKIGEKLNTEGLKVNLIYSSGAQQETYKYKTEYSFNSTGSKTVQVKVNNLSDSFNVTVENREAREIYFKNSCNWDTPHAYFWNDNGAPAAWPGTQMDYVGYDKNGKDIYRITVGNNCNKIIFNNGSDSEKTKDINLDNYSETDGFDVEESSNQSSFSTFIYNSNDMDYIGNKPTTNESKLYFINEANWNNVYCYMWNDSVNNSQNQSWPGKPITTYDTDQNGNKIYSCDFDASRYDRVIFNNGNGVQSSDLTPQANQYYDYVSQKWYRSVQAFMDNKNPRQETVYLINSKKWNSANCYMFNFENQTLTNGSWPGNAMTYESTETDGITVYSYTYPSTYNRCIFSQNGSKQTADLVTRPGMYYDNTSNKWFNSLNEYFNQQSDTKESTVYFICPSDWNSPYAYYYDSENTSVVKKAWPGDAMQKIDLLSNGKSICSSTFDSNKFDRVVFSNQGEQQTNDLEIHSGMYYDIASDNWYKNLSDYNEIIPTNMKKFYFINSQKWTHSYCYFLNEDSDQQWKLNGMKLENTTENGSEIYSCTVDCLKYDSIAFTDGTVTTEVLTPKNNKYYDSYSEKWYSSIESYLNNCPDSTKTFSVINSKNWSNVNCYIWNSLNEQCVLNSWPGKLMEKSSTTENGFDIYSLDYNEAVYDRIIFNNGSQQTDDLVIEDGAYYDLAQNKWFNSLESYYDSFKNHYYLCGYINNEDYGIGGDSKALGDYLFTNGELRVHFDDDSYVLVKDQDNKSYMTNGLYGRESNGAVLKNRNLLGDNADKLFVPGGKTVKFNLSENDDETLTLSYSYEGINPSGDVNFDGKTDILDVTHIQRCCLGTIDYNDDQIRSIDYNHDNKLSIRDATLLQMKLVHIDVENGTVEVNHYLSNDNGEYEKIGETEIMKGKHGTPFEVNPLNKNIYQLDTDKSSPIREGTFTVMKTITVDLYYTDISKTTKLHLKNANSQENWSPYLWVWAGDSDKTNLNNNNIWPGDTAALNNEDGWFEYSFKRNAAYGYNLILSYNGSIKTKDFKGFNNDELWIIYNPNDNGIEMECYTENPETNSNAPIASYTVA